MAAKQTDEKPTPKSLSGETNVVPKATQALNQDERLHGELQPHIHLRTYAAVFAVGLIYLAQNFAIVGAGSQGNIIAGIFGDSGDASWLTAILAIFTVVLGPIVSQASDYWGRKWFLVVLSFLGGIGALIVSRATDMAIAIGGFCVVGLAFGAQPLVHAVSSEVIPRRWRSWGQASAMIFTALGLVSGLLVAGAVNRTGNMDGFRYYYYICAGLFILASGICALAYRPLPTKLQLELDFGEKMARLDWIGYGLLTSSLVLFCIALSWSLNPYPWSDAHVSAAFAVSIVLAALLALYEWKFRSDGLFNHGLFQQNRMFTVCLFCVMSEGVAFFAANTYFAFEVNVLYENDFLLVTTRFAIGFMATVVASFVTGLYCAKTKKVRWATFVAFLSFIAFFAAMASTTKDTSYLTWGLPVLMGWGLGMTLVALITAAQLCVPHELITIASGLLISVRSLGGTIGIAIYQAVFSSAMSHLGANVASAATAAGLPAESIPFFIGNLTSQNITGLSLVPNITPDIIDAGAGALLDTYALGFRYVWLSAVAFVAVAALLALFMFDPSKEFNQHIDAPVEKEEDLYAL